MTLTSKQRAYLKSLASKIDPAFSLGKSAVTHDIIAAFGEYFAANELLKINILKNCDADPKEMAETIAERTRSTVVQIIGRKIVLYKPNKDKPKIELPSAAKGKDKSHEK